MRERDALAIRRIDENVFDVVHLPLVLFQPDGDGESLLSFPQLSGLFTAERGLNDVLNISDVQAITRALCAIDRNL